MNAAIIKIRSANPPQEGKKQGKIEADDGTIYGVWPDKLGMVREGRAYRVEFKESDFKGRTYKTITKIEPIEEPRERPVADSSHLAECEFVVTILSAAIKACAVAHTEQALVDYVRTLRSVYRKALV